MLDSLHLLSSTGTR